MSKIYKINLSKYWMRITAMWLLYSIKLKTKELPKNRNFWKESQSEKKKLFWIYRKMQTEQLIKSNLMM